MGKSADSMMLVEDSDATGFDFDNWLEEDQGSALEAMDQVDFSHTRRKDFIEMSHGENAGSLSPINSLRRCLSPCRSPGSEKSPLRSRQMSNASDSVPDAMDEWRTV